MSADNGIYIASFHGDNGTEWRVIHTQAIENIGYFPEGTPEEAAEIVSYFERGKSFDNEESAILYAHKFSREFDILEYGISRVGSFPHSLAHYKELAKQAPKQK